VLSKKVRFRGAALAAIAIGAAPEAASQSGAAAFYLQEQSVKAAGRAFSGEVSEQGAQQMWWNPAAIGGIYNAQSYFGLNAILPRADATDNGTTVSRPGISILDPSFPRDVRPAGGNSNARDPVNKGYLPNGGFAFPINRHWAIGLTATSPYSFTANYDADSWARYEADKTRLRTYDLQPVIAFSSGGVSIGAGPTLTMSARPCRTRYPIRSANSLMASNILKGAAGMWAGAPVFNIMTSSST
jgi:long-chain fatty acid transport protein